MKMITTTDYDQFRFFDRNREVSESNVKAKMNVLERKPLFHLFPIVVDKNMRVVEGQNRLLAAQRLNIPVIYVKDDSLTIEDIVWINNCQKPWKMTDYLRFYSPINENYSKLSDFLSTHQMSIPVFLRILKKQGGVSSETYKSGKFIFPDPEKIEKLEKAIAQANSITDYLLASTIGKRRYFESVSYRVGIIQFLLWDEVDFELFFHKVQLKTQSIVKCSSKDEAISNFIDLYNYGNRDPIAINLRRTPS